MTDNGLLIGLSLLEGIEPLLKVGKREQLNRVSLNAIHTSLVKVLEYITRANLSNAYISGRLIDISGTIDMMLQSDDFIETDTELKEIICKKVLESLSELYLEVGKYYTTVDFEYNVRFNKLLNKVIDACFDSGYYFGINMDKLVYEAKQEANL